MSECFEVGVVGGTTRSEIRGRTGSRKHDREGRRSTRRGLEKHCWRGVGSPQSTINGPWRGLVDPYLSNGGGSTLRIEFGLVDGGRTRSREK